MPKIEFTAGEGGNFELLPVGTYNFRITKVEAKPNKEGTGNVLHVKCSVNDGPMEDKKVTLFCTLKDAKGWQLAGLLAACIPGKYEEMDTGIKDDDGKPIKTYSFDTDDLVDCVFTADIEHRKDNKEQMQADFKRIRETDAGSASSNNNAPASSEAPQQAEGGGERTLRRRVAAG